MFIGLFSWIDLTFFGLLALLWFPLAGRRRIHPLLAAYDYLFITASTISFCLAVKFKVLAYFNDTINFLIVRNLGRGSLVAALHYILDENHPFRPSGWRNWRNYIDLLDRKKAFTTSLASDYRPIDALAGALYCHNRAPGFHNRGTRLADQ